MSPLFSFYYVPNNNYLETYFTKQWILQQLSLKNPPIRNFLGLAPEKFLKRISTENVTPDNHDILQRGIPAETLSPEKLLDVSIW